MPLLAEGIRIHGEKLTEQLKPLHDRLTACFKELKKKVEKQYGVITLVSAPASVGFFSPYRNAPLLYPACELVVGGGSRARLRAASLLRREETEQVRLCRAALHHVFHAETSLRHLCGVFGRVHVFHVI